jgi:hypothetical protein
MGYNPTANDGAASAKKRFRRPRRTVAEPEFPMVLTMQKPRAQIPEGLFLQRHALPFM